MGWRSVWCSWRRVARSRRSLRCRSRPNPPKKRGVCDKCGSALVQREDDTERVVRTRIKTYDELTEPIAAFYRAKGLLRDVYASGHIEEVRHRILEVLRK